MLKKTLLSLVAFGLITAPLFSAMAADDGAALYSKKCKMCHGANGDGKNDKGEVTAMMKKVDAAKQTLNRAMTDEEIKKSMTDGVGTMKPVKGLTDGEITALVAHTKTFKK